MSRKLPIVSRKAASKTCLSLCDLLVAPKRRGAMKMLSENQGNNATNEVDCEVVADHTLACTHLCGPQNACQTFSSSSSPHLRFWWHVPSHALQKSIQIYLICGHCLRSKSGQVSFESSSGSRQTGLGQVGVMP